MKNKEVLFVSNFFGDGGAARVISVLAEELANRGYAVTVCSYPRKDREEYRRAANVKYVRFEMKHRKGVLYKIERIAKLRKEIRKHKDATVISFEYFMNMQTVVAMAGLGNRLIISERNDPAAVGGKTPTRQLRNFLYGFADCLVCQTRDALEYFPKNIQRKSTVIMNPIKENLPEPWQGERKKQVVNFCRLEKQKNLPLLIDAFEAFYQTHPDYTLVIYGNGKERDSLTEYIRTKKLEKVITLHPAVQDVHDRVKDAEMFVSSSDYEGLSNSMIEAMAIGLPVICTDCPCGGARMVIADGVNGLLVPMKDKEALAEKMRCVAEDGSLRERLSQNAKLISAELSSRKIADLWISAIAEGKNENFSMR